MPNRRGVRGAVVATTACADYPFLCVRARVYWSRARAASWLILTVRILAALAVDGDLPLPQVEVAAVGAPGS